MPQPAVRPRRLAPGDVVGIAAPGSPVREELLARGEDWLRGLGLVPRRAPHVLARGRYTAGTPDERAADLAGLMADPEVRAIFCARGGYGSPQLIPLLDPGLLLKDPKPLVGASDVTALFLWALRRGVAVLHGPMPAQEMQQGRAEGPDLLRHLMGIEPSGALAAPAARTLHPGRASGWLTGGCLSLVAASVGTPWAIDCDGAIVFLEDVDTKPYQIDRMLTQLIQSGCLSGARGLVFGEMKGCLQHPDQGYTLDQVLADLTAPLGVPVVAGLPCGHTTGVHRALPLGVAASLDAPDGEEASGPRRPRLFLEQALVV